jgi:hypothetical protein
MQNSFIQTQGDKLVIDQGQLTTYAIAAAAVIVVVILIVVAMKRRKKGFIKTVPTNLKEGE